MTDFNDLYVQAGAAAVRNAIENATMPENATSVACAPENDWPPLQPLTHSAHPVRYPVEALPATIRAAVEEVSAFVQAPVSLVATTALAALSLAVQAHVDVQRAENLTGPTGLFLLTIAESGERKSTCDSFFSRPIRDYQTRQAEGAKPLLADYHAALEAWEAKQAGIKEQIRNCAKAGKPTADSESALRDLAHQKPEAPRVPRLLYSDVTPEALALGLAKHWPSGGVMSSEAGSVFGSHGMSGDSIMRNLAMLNQLWDGAGLSIDRKSSESFTVKGARLSVALQVQEPTLRSFFEKSGTLARGTGFLARFLIAWPESTQGTRFFTDPPAQWPALTQFHHRIDQVLEMAAPLDDDGALQPILMALSPAAKALWVEYYDAVETALGRGGEYREVSDVASKSADNAARLAALFQVFEHGLGRIVEAEAMGRAIAITAWHLDEARRFFGQVTVTPERADALRLETWLLGYCHDHATNDVCKNHVRQRGPGPLRDGQRLDAALAALSGLNHIKLAKVGRGNRILINPALLEVHT